MSEETQTAPDIWAGDHLGRREEAIYLSNYLAARFQAKAEENGFVLAVNGDWGMGKSFMLQRWCEQMKVAGHPVVQFDAWENDYTPEPLVAFIAELNRALGPQFDKMPLGQKLHAQWYEKAKAVLIPGLKTAGFALAKHGLGMGAAQLSEVWENDGNEDSEDVTDFDTKALSAKLEKIVEDALKSHSNTRLAIKAFKERLASLIKHLASEGVQLPICIFIDELDRCRPDYAIELLEGIKHLFGVPGLHFVVATNITELAHSVRAVYGSGFSADRYLKRFFDMEYALPEPDASNFAVELMTPLVGSQQTILITGLDQLLNVTQKRALGLPYIFERYAAAFALPLRDQQQVARILEAAFITLAGRPIHIHFLMFLAMLYQKNASVYHKVARALNLAQPTGFYDAIPQIDSVHFRVPRIDGAGLSNIPVTQIVEVFFSFLKDNHRNGAINSDNFPINLFIGLARDKGGAESLRQYLDIVRFAGRFAK